MKSLAVLFIGVAAFVTHASVSLADDAQCVGGPTLYSCVDAQGNSYTISKLGSMTQVNGSNGRTGSTWSQNSMTFGNQTFTSGTAADGGQWNMNQMTLGNGWTSTTGRDSNGNSFSTLCGPTGCN